MKKHIVTKEDLKKVWDASSAYTTASHKDFKQTHPDFETFYKMDFLADNIINNMENKMIENTETDLRKLNLNVNHVIYGSSYTLIEWVIKEMRELQVNPTLDHLLMATKEDLEPLIEKELLPLISTKDIVYFITYNDDDDFMTLYSINKNEK